DFVVIFGAGIDLGNAVDNFAKGNAAAEIADGNAITLDPNLDFLAVAHDEFIDGVIDHFLQEDIAAIVGIGAVADAANIHAGAQADVLEGGEGFDFALVVIVLRVFSHNLTSFRVEQNARRCKQEI